MPRSKEMDLPIRFEASPILFNASEIASLMGYNGKPPANQPMGHVPPPPPPRRAMAQSGRATAVNVAMSEQALRLSIATGMSFSAALDGLMSAARAGILESTKTASAKPVPPGTDLSKPRKRKIELE